MRSGLHYDEANFLQRESRALQIGDHVMKSGFRILCRPPWAALMAVVASAQTTSPRETQNTALPGAGAPEVSRVSTALGDGPSLEETINYINSKFSTDFSNPNHLLSNISFQRGGRSNPLSLRDSWKEPHRSFHVSYCCGHISSCKAKTFCSQARRKDDGRSQACGAKDSTVKDIY